MTDLSAIEVWAQHEARSQDFVYVDEEFAFRDGLMHAFTLLLSDPAVEAAIEAADAEIASYDARVEGELLYGPESDMPERTVRAALSAALDTITKEKK